MKGSVDPDTVAALSHSLNMQVLQRYYRLCKWALRMVYFRTIRYRRFLVLLALFSRAEHCTCILSSHISLVAAVIDAQFVTEQWITSLSSRIGE